MASFFEKLKKGMGVEDPVEEDEENKEESETTDNDSEEETEEEEAEKIDEEEAEKEEEEVEKKINKKAKLIKKEKKPVQGKKIEVKEKISEERLVLTELLKEQKQEKESGSANEEEKWPPLDKKEEGQLAVDVYQTENDLVIQSTVAGVKPENLDILMERDIITIKGSRERPFQEKGDYFIQECFWGAFSREIILPAEVDPERTAAEMKNNILTIRIPKILREKKRKIIVRG